MVELRVFRGYHFIEEDAGYHTKWQERIDPLMSTASTRFCSIWCDCSDDGTGNWLFCFLLSSTHSSILGTNFLLDLSSGSMFLFFLPLLHHLILVFFFEDWYGDVTKKQVIHDGSECHWWFWFCNHSGSPPLLLRSSLVMEQLLP